MVVEDRIKRCKILSDLFELNGFISLDFNEGGSAIDYIRGGLVYDALIVDLSLGENTLYTGLDVINQSKALHPRTPVISISGYGAKLPGVDRHFYSGDGKKLDELVPIIESFIKRWLLFV